MDDRTIIIRPGVSSRGGSSMSARTDRRRFLQTAAAGGALVGLGDLGFLSRLRPVSADEARLDPKVVRLNPEIEPLVRLLEETPRGRLLEEVAGRIKRGTAYRDLRAALLLAGALVYTSFSASSPARTPSQLAASARSGQAYRLTGKVVDGSVRRHGAGMDFRVRDRDGTTSIPVRYTGEVPDPFREGREVIVSGQMRNGTFVAERDSLVTKCPSKFTNGKDGAA